jgi:hypothetical protein
MAYIDTITEVLFQNGRVHLQAGLSVNLGFQKQSAETQATNICPLPEAADRGDLSDARATDENVTAQFLAREGRSK